MEPADPSTADAKAPPPPPRAAARPHVPLVAAAAGATLLLSALWWTVSPRPAPDDGPAIAAVAAPQQPRPAQRHVAADRAPARAEAAQPEPVATVRAAAPRRTTGRPALPADPRELCGDRRFFALLACVKRECERPEVSGHPECRRMADLETPAPQP
jgi:hypothetical protein